jgi:uncharacterized Zn finger protein
MREICFCGRIGALEDREAVLEEGARWMLRCPECGHLDDLGWMDEEKALTLWISLHLQEPHRVEVSAG